MECAGSRFPALPYHHRARRPVACPVAVIGPHGSARVWPGDERMTQASWRDDGPAPQRVLSHRLHAHGEPGEQLRGGVLTPLNDAAGSIRFAGKHQDSTGLSILLTIQYSEIRASA